MNPEYKAKLQEDCKAAIAAGGELEQNVDFYSKGCPGLVCNLHMGRIAKSESGHERRVEVGGRPLQAPVLLFDEADALFGKRSAVRDSHDRYANIEISYLLQKMEAHDGLAILATNMKAHLDAAFLRRLPYKIHVTAPSEDDLADRPLPAGRLREGIAAAAVADAAPGIGTRPSADAITPRNCFRSTGLVRW